MRERLTITLKQDILDALDEKIDGDRLRNRSHAIEYYLSKSLGRKALRVLILAAGKAVDFGAQGGKLPKAMIKIAGKPLLEQTLLKLKAAKFQEAIISLGEGGAVIKDYFKDGSALGLHLKYIEQDGQVKGPASALWQAKSLVGGGNFLLLYGDVLSDIDYNDFIQFHALNKPSVCTMALTAAEEPRGLWGLARLQGSRVVEFEEKPKNPKTFSRLINAGIFLLEPEIFKLLNAATIKLESTVFPRLAQEGRLYGYAYEGLWLDISSSAAYKQVVKEISNSK